MKKIFNLPKNLYVSESPIIISEGGLYRNEEDASISVGLKVKKVVSEEVENFRLVVKTFDSLWKPLRKDIEYVFTQFHEDENFFQVSNPDKDLAAIEVFVSEVKFKNGDLWENESEQWFSLEEDDIVDGKFFNEELLKERKLQFAEKQSQVEGN